MEKFIWFEGERFRIREYFDANVKEFQVEPKTGQAVKVSKGDIYGVEIYSPSDELIGCFDYIDFDNEEAIRKIIEHHYPIPIK